MSTRVVVLGSGYAGARAVQHLERAPGPLDLAWVSDVDYHLVLHESHRCIRDPGVREHLTVPVERVKSAETEFVQARVTGLDTDRRVVDLASGELEYDYLLVCLGSRTAFFDIEGLSEHAHTMKGLDDAVAIHDELDRAAREATSEDPARVVVGGAGLTGIQVAGEVAAFRDQHETPVEVRLIEGQAEIYPGSDPSLQAALRDLLAEHGVAVTTGEFVSRVDDRLVHTADGEYAYDVLVWTGGIAGHDELRDAEVRADERDFRFETDPTFRTSDERVFAVGDSARVEQPDGHAPPTAQAAWQAAPVAARNVARAVRGADLDEWRYSHKGTVVSVGDDAVAHDIAGLPVVSTVGGLPARTLKKAIATRWIRSVAGLRRALAAWPRM